MSDKVNTHTHAHAHTSIISGVSGSLRVLLGFEQNSLLTVQFWFRFRIRISASVHADDGNDSLKLPPSAANRTSSNGSDRLGCDDAVSLARTELTDRVDRV